MEGARPMQLGPCLHDASPNLQCYWHQSYILWDTEQKFSISDFKEFYLKLPLYFLDIRPSRLECKILCSLFKFQLCNWSQYISYSIQSSSFYGLLNSMTCLGFPVLWKIISWGPKRMGFDSMCKILEKSAKPSTVVITAQDQSGNLQSNNAYESFIDCSTN